MTTIDNLYKMLKMVQVFLDILNHWRKILNSSQLWTSATWKKRYPYCTTYIFNIISCSTLNLLVLVLVATCINLKTRPAHFHIRQYTKQMFNINMVLIWRGFHGAVALLRFPFHFWFSRSSSSFLILSIPLIRLKQSISLDLKGGLAINIKYQVKN